MGTPALGGCLEPLPVSSAGPTSTADILLHVFDPSYVYLGPNKSLKNMFGLWSKNEIWCGAYPRVEVQRRGQVHWPPSGSDSDDPVEKQAISE
jgi:hypothetical protein